MKSVKARNILPVHVMSKLTVYMSTRVCRRLVLITGTRCNLPPLLLEDIMDVVGYENLPITLRFDRLDFPKIKRGAPSTKERRKAVRRIRKGENYIVVANSIGRRPSTVLKWVKNANKNR